MSQVADPPSAGAPGPPKGVDVKAQAKGTPGHSAGRFAYRPAIDGLRAVAVVAVLLYHARVSWASGGFLGVDLFFVLSGYLITTLLLLEWDDTGGVDFKAFWGRRARRLIPALFLVIALIAVYQMTLATAVENSKFAGDAFGTLAYVANWRFAFSEQSYFEQFNAPSMLRHTWSLGIEEQFYIFWPLIVLVGMKVFRLQITKWVIGLLAAVWISAALMLLFFDPASDPSRVYYGTDTRMQAPLLGAALAFVLHEVDLRRFGRVSLQAVGGAGILVFLAMFTLVHDSDNWMYQGGYLLASVAGAAAIAAATSPRDNLFTHALAWGPLVWIGKRSYGLYLLHWPIYVLLDAHTDLTGWSLVVVKLGLTFGAAMLSYRLIEMPIRQRSLTPKQERVALVGSIAGLVILILLATSVFAPEPEGIASADPGVGEDGECQSAEDAAVPPGDKRVLVVGDSVAFSFGFYWREAALPGMRVATCAILGCGVARGTALPLDRDPVPPKPACEKWPANWRDAAAAFKPDVTVMLIGAWEIFDREVDGQEMTVDSDAYRDYLQGELDLAADILAADGKPVVLLSVPCMDVPAKGTPWVERGQEERVDAVNEIFRDWAPKHPEVSLVDLHGYVCPTGQYQSSVDGVALHEDGAHYLPEGSAKVWQWLWPQLQTIMGQG